MVPNGEGEPVWLTPHQRDSQPEGERERDANNRIVVGFELQSVSE